MLHWLRRGPGCAPRDEDTCDYIYYFPPCLHAFLPQRLLFGEVAATFDPRSIHGRGGEPVKGCSQLDVLLLCAALHCCTATCYCCCPVHTMLCSSMLIRARDWHYNNHRHTHGAKHHKAAPLQPTASGEVNNEGSLWLERESSASP